MNAQINAVLSKLTFGTMFFIAVVAAQAQSPAPVAGDKETPAVVRYVGIEDDMVIFTVAYKNPGGSPFSVIVKDQDGTQLYQSVYKEKNFFKQFRLTRADKSKVVFVFRDFKGSEIAKTFEINVNSRWVAQVAVKKVN